MAIELDAELLAGPSDRPRPDAIRRLEDPWRTLRPAARPARRLHRRQPVLSNKFWGLWAATGVSSLGDGLVTIGLPLLAATMTRDPLALSGVVVAIQAPWLLFSMFWGALADRTDRRRMAITIEVVRMVFLVIVGGVLIAGGRSLPLVYLTGFGLGTLEAGFFAATSSAVPDLVPRDGLSAANGHMMAVKAATENFLGVAIGGLIFAVAVSLPFVLDGISFAVSAVLLVMVLPVSAARLRSGLPSVAAAPRSKLREDAVAGLRFLWFEPALRLALMAVVVLAICQSMVFGLLVAYGLGGLHLSGAGIGLFMAFGSSGSIVGGFFGGRIHRRLSYAQMLLAGGLAAAAGYLALSATHSGLVGAAAMFCEGLGVVVGNVASATIRHERVPNALMGRVNSGFRMAVYGLMPIGAFVGGVLGHLTSPRLAIFAAGIIQLGALSLLYRPLTERVVDDELVIDVDPPVDLRLVEVPAEQA